eukprot:754406-Hanusia_phi.AAC.5
MAWLTPPAHRYKWQTRSDNYESPLFFIWAIWFTVDLALVYSNGHLYRLPWWKNQALVVVSLLMFTPILVLLLLNGTDYNCAFKVVRCTNRRRFVASQHVPLSLRENRRRRMARAVGEHLLLRRLQGTFFPPYSSSSLESLPGRPACHSGAGQPVARTGLFQGGLGSSRAGKAWWVEDLNFECLWAGLGSHETKVERLIGSDW